MKDRDSKVAVTDMGNHDYERAASSEHSDNEDAGSLLESHEAKLDIDLEEQKHEKPKRPSSSLMMWIAINILATIGIVSAVNQYSQTYADRKMCRSSPTNVFSLIHPSEEHNSRSHASTSLSLSRLCTSSPVLDSATLSGERLLSGRSYL
jgi:hypothetical protein